MSEPGLSQRLWEANADLARASLEHPFVQGLADGTLPDETYAFFSGQDHFYLDVFARCYALGAYRAPDRASRRKFGQLLGGLVTEGTLHERTAEELDLDLESAEPAPAAREYTDFLLASSAVGTLGEHLAAMAPCARLYRFLGTQLADRPYDPKYKFWIEMYAGDRYGGNVDVVEALLDQHGRDAPGERSKYRTAMQLELNFFESAWNGGQ